MPAVFSNHCIASVGACSTEHSPHREKERESQREVGVKWQVESGLYVLLIFLQNNIFFKPSKRGFPRKFACFILFHLIKKHSFNFLCVLDDICSAEDSAV